MDWRNPPYAPAYVSSIVRSAGWDLDYIDLNNILYQHCADEIRNNWENVEYWEEHEFDRRLISDHFDLILRELREVLSARPCGLIGIGHMQETRRFAPHILRAIRQSGPGIPVLFGGSDCFPAHHGLKYLDDEYAPDVILQGEAEIALPAFLREFQATRSCETSISGFAFRSKQGRIVDRGVPDQPTLRESPICADYSIFFRDDKHDYRPVLRTFTSKGCINKCSFCNEWSNYKPYRRRRDHKDVIREIEHNVRVVTDSIPSKRRYLLGFIPGRRKRVTGSRPGDRRIGLGFVESNLNVSEDYVRKLCSDLADKNLNLAWNAMCCFRVGLSEETLRMMHRSGCNFIMWGLETGSQRIIDLIGKNYDINKAQSQILKSQAAGIGNRLPLINGFPGEFTNDFITTSAFILKNRDEKNVLFSYSNTCIIKENTYLSLYPDDYLLKDTTTYDFELRDGFNNQPLRELRQSINMLLMKESRPGAYFDAIKAMQDNIDFNDPAVASELAKVLYILGKLNDDAERILDFLLNGSGKFERREGAGPSESARIAFLSHILPGFNLKDWFAADKNAKGCKKEIIDLLTEQYDTLTSSLKGTETVDFKGFRDSLFHLDSFDEIDARPDGYRLENVRRSKCNNGRFVIFEGRMIDLRNQCPASRIEASAGDNLFDVHYGIFRPDVAQEMEDEVCGFAGFWGKVKATDLEERGVRLKVICRDGKAYTFDADIALP